MFQYHWDCTECDYSLFMFLNCVQGRGVGGSIPLYDGWFRFLLLFWFFMKQRVMSLQTSVIVTQFTLGAFIS